MSKRILSLDLLRGIAIIGDLVVHLVLLTSDMVTQAEADPFSLGPFYLFIALLVIIFGHWRGFCLMISAIGHTLSMTNAIRNGADRKSILKKQLSFGFFLFIWGLFREIFLNEWTTPRRWLETGTFNPFLSWKQIYVPDALENIALSIIFTSIIFFILFAKKGVEKMKRNCIWLGILTVIVIFLPTLLYTFFNNFLGGSFPRYGGPPEFRAWWDYPLQLIYSQLLATESPLIPHMAYFLFGCIIGFIFSQKISIKKLLWWGFSTGIFLIGLGIVWLLFVDGIPEDISRLIGFQTHPAWFIFLSLGMQLIGILLFMSMVEFNKRIKLERYLRRTQHIRRWGILALSAYCLLWIQYPLRWLFSKILPTYNFINVNQLPFNIMVVLLIVDACCLALILFLWQKVKFAGSLEWWMAKIMKRKKKGKKGDTLNIEGLLINPEPILWIHPIFPTELSYHYQGTEPKEEPVKLIN